MKIYRYMPRHPEYDKPELPIADVWLWEDYPNGILTNTPTHDMTLHEYETFIDKANGYPPRHKPEEERNFIHYTVSVSGNEHSRMKFEKLYKLRYYEVSCLEEFLFGNPETEILFHRGHIFEKTWMD